MLGRWNPPKNDKHHSIYSKTYAFNSHDVLFLKEKNTSLEQSKTGGLGKVLDAIRPGVAVRLRQDVGGEDPLVPR